MAVADIMGAIWSYLWPSPSAEQLTDTSLDIPDPVTQLTPRQKMVIRENWAVVKQNMKQVGVYLFVEFFRAHPPYQKYFRSFADVPFEELATNKKVEAHASNVMYAISCMVDNLDDVDCLKELLIKTGENHKRRKVVPGQFEQLAVVILKVLDDKLGSTFTPFARDAWAEALKVMNSLIVTGLENEE